MRIQEISEEGYIRLDPEGKIDTSSAQEFQNAILGAFQKTDNVVVNLEGVDYLSSIALRTILTGQKTAKGRGGSFAVINVSSPVMDIFRVVGFDKIIEIR